MTTERQIAANRINGLKGGVKTAEGKAISRLNARKHGIFALALTAEDAAQLGDIEGELAADLKPVGVVEEILVEKMALTFMRMRRCARMEAEHYRLREQCNWANGRVQRDQIVVTLGHYDIRLTNQFLRLSHELERLREMRTTAQRDGPQISQIPQMKNEPNRAVFECRSAVAEAAADGVAQPPAAVQLDLDSRVRGNDNEGMKNEPNFPPLPGTSVPQVPIPPIPQFPRKFDNIPEAM